MPARKHLPWAETDMSRPDKHNEPLIGKRDIQPDIEIARSVAPQSILLLAQQRLGLPPESLIPFGHYKAKIDLEQVVTADPRN